MHGKLKCGVIINKDIITVENYKTFLSHENYEFLILLILDNLLYCDDIEDSEETDLDQLIKDYPITLEIAKTKDFGRCVKLYLMNNYCLFKENFGKMLLEEMNFQSHSFNNSLSKYHETLMDIAYRFLKSCPQLQDFICKNENVTFEESGLDSDQMWYDLEKNAF